jgi:signal transduction histidine kinase
VMHTQAHTSRHAIALEALVITGNRMRLRQPLDHLLTNAIKYEPDSGASGSSQ